MDASQPSLLEITATILFAAAVLHTFVCGFFRKLASNYSSGSVPELFFHLLGEVEVVFGFWAALFLICSCLMVSTSQTIENVESLSFTEPLFVFAVMCIASTKPVLDFAQNLIFLLSQIIPIRKKEPVVYFLCLTFGALLGSLITEPAAMTVAALILRERFYSEKISERFKYATLAALFVNISIGGVLTSFAAPPVIMVASKWNWDSLFMMEHFGFKSCIAVFCNAALATFLCSKELQKINFSKKNQKLKIPHWIKILNLFFLGAVVATAHHPVVFLGIFLYFLGFVQVTKQYNDELKIKESLLVAFFLAGLVVLGFYQSWWIKNILVKLDSTSLFFGAAALTSITDNAALTYLGAQLEGLSHAFQFALVSGAVVAGGLTVIANAPNPAGYSILQDRFGEKGIQALKLFLFALPPTIIAMLIFLLFPA